jgi:hypothetical protein
MQPQPTGDASMITDIVDGGSTTGIPAVTSGNHAERGVLGDGMTR